MDSIILLEPIDPMPRPTPEAPYPPTPAEGTPSDPVNVPPPGPDVIFPDHEPLGIPTGPGLDVPEIPMPPARM